MAQFFLVFEASRSCLFIVNFTGVFYHNHRIIHWFVLEGSLKPVPIGRI